MKITDEELINELQIRCVANKKSMQELEDITNELKKVNIKLTESEKMKTHFISNITNELINPFASILGLSKNILSAKKEQWDRVQNMVQLIHSEAFHLDFQLKNIFAAAEIEGGALTPDISIVDIVGVVHSAIDSFAHEISKKEIHIRLNLGEIDKILKFNTDSSKFYLIVCNLLSNAIKYSSATAVIDIGIFKKDDNFSLSVTDYGIGIAEDHHEIIFDRFARLDIGINSINRGHGLGLSIVKAYLDILKGQIEVNSSIGKGAKFVVTLKEEELSSVEGFSSDVNDVFFEEEVF